MFPHLFGKYMLERELASGGMAKVYLATLRGAVGFEKQLVVKQIRPELASDPAFVRRFVEEAKTTVHLSHPNIVPVYELGVEQGVYYIAMEFCPGATLAEVLAATGKLSSEEGAYVGVEVCRALDYAHRRAGIVHRDVTPRNVLIDEEGAVRLIDFGIAAPVEGSGRESREVFGSPGHMPPEQLAGDALSAATDVFAVGALLFEAWSGRPAFRRATLEETERALREPVPELDRIEPALAPVAPLLSRALALSPAERPSQPEALARPLREFLRSSDTGDVARRLGARVQRVAGRTRSPEPAVQPVLADEAADRESTSPTMLGTSTTYTLAARPEVAAWTRQIELPASPPVLDAGVSTRKLPLEGEGDAPARTRRMRLNARWKPGLVVASAVGGIGLITGALLITSSSSRGASSMVHPDADKDSRSVELPAQVTDLYPSQRSSGPARGDAGQPTSRASDTSRAAEEPAQKRSEEREGSPARRGGSAASTVELASLRLTADLPATVTLEGASGVHSLSTPVTALRVPSGTYTVSFRSATYGAPVTARLSLFPGEKRQVHVEFRDAEPRVSVR